MVYALWHKFIVRGNTLDPSIVMRVGWCVGWYASLFRPCCRRAMGALPFKFMYTRSLVLAKLSCMAEPCVVGEVRLVGTSPSRRWADLIGWTCANGQIEQEEG